MNRINLVILGCIGVSLFFWFFGVNMPVDEYLAFSWNNLVKGRVWTVVTALFLHADVAHLAGNMLFLYVFGNTLENELKSEKTLSAFFAGGIIAFILSTFFYSPSDYMIGASAAIFTLTAIVMLVKPLKFSFAFMMPQGLVAFLYFAYNILMIYFGEESNVAYISHIIGFIIGLAFGAMWSKNLAKNLLITLGLFLIYAVVMLLVVPQLLQTILRCVF